MVLIYIGILFIICLPIIVFSVFLFLGFNTKLQNKIDKIFNKNKPNIDNIYKNMNEMLKPMEKIEVIKELFIYCAEYTSHTLSDSNSIKEAVYTCELALYIFSLWTVKKLTKISKIEDASAFLNSPKFNAYIIALKSSLNTLITKILAKDEIDHDTVKNLIVSRTKSILKTDDIEVHNFNFINLCNYAIKSEDINIFATKDIDKMPVEFSNSANLLNIFEEMIFLPNFFRTGLIKDMMYKFDKAF